MLAQGKPCAFNTPFGYIHGWTLVSKKVSADTASRGSIGGVRHAVAMCPCDRMSDPSFGPTAAVSARTILHCRESASCIGYGQ